MANLQQLPAEAVITFVRGDDFPLDVEVQDDEGNPIDFSTWSNLTLEVRELEKNGGALLEDFVQGTDLTVTAGGRVQATFTSSATSSWSNKYVVYELEGDDSNSKHRSILRGQIELFDEIAKS
jgi:hypothetical protein